MGSLLTSWDARFLGLAEHIASWSRDPSTRVGCVAVGDTPNLVATGFNGLPPGLRDDDRLLDRAWKYEHVVHAEMNALANATFPVRTLYVTQPCCHRCAVHILSHRTVRRVVCLQTAEFRRRWGESIERSVEVFSEARIEFEIVEDLHEPV
ncbi:deaminase [Telmatospirillum sp.]|uniref:deoxycytidylate deaminase n=1 Tax=Telmatospirillum sp. TaxID=2079197 RepID=UPI002850AEDE|nr:deaminase [Telmatospirillum sp.]MDR3436466.1 deaminase [Telmatospirillum sp.]